MAFPLGALLLFARFTTPPPELQKQFGERAELLSVIGATAVTLSISYILLTYLQGTRSFTPYGTTELVERLIQRVHMLEREVERGGAANISGTSPPISEAERKDLLLRLREDITAELTTTLTAELRESLTAAYRQDMLRHERERLFTRTLQRLSAEVDGLGRRGNLNLVLGILTTASGLGLLGFFVITHPVAATTLQAFIAHFIPRLSLVLFVELFAFFFLRLYKSTLAELKYFQNEMTNVEMKFMALHEAAGAGEAALADVISNIVQTERNHILDKGQTTVELERARIDREQLIAALGALTSRGVSKGA